MNTNTTKQVKIETATIEAAAHDSGMTPEQYVARHHSFFNGKQMTAEKTGTEDGGRVTVFEVRPTNILPPMQAAFGCRRHTRAQLTRAERRLASMDGEGRRHFERLAAMYDVTPAQAVANVSKIVNAPNGDGSRYGAIGRAPKLTAADWEKLAAKYGVTVKQLRGMSVDKMCRMFAEASCKAAKGARA